jgi:hypothetical protein
MLRRGIGRVGRPSLIGAAATTAVVAGTATAVSGHMRNKQAEKAETQAEAQAYEQEQMQAQQAAMAQQAAAAAPPPPPPAPAPAAAPAGGISDDTIAKLQQLAELNKLGILTDEEFAAEKAKLLA